MKKLNFLVFLPVLVVGLLFGVFFSVAAQDQLEIAFIRASGEAYYQYGTDAAKLAADELGVEMRTYTSSYDTAKELANVQDAVQRGVDGIIMYAVSLSSERAAINAAKEGDVPIFLQYGYKKEYLPETAGFMQIDIFEFGKKLGEWTAVSVDEGKVAIIQGALGRGDAEAYTEGYIEGLANNPDLEVVSKPAADWNRQKASDATADIINAHQDLSVLFVQNEDMARGSVLALRRAGKLDQVTVVSMNGAPYGLDMIRDGSLALTNANPPSIASVMSLRLLLGVIEGEVEPGHFYWAPTQLISSANIGVAIPWDATQEDVRAWLERPLPDAVIPPPES
ncbi:MAG: sugar ABC transporter substrate-binding protein [Candidatus Acetothermia bacterium]